MTGKLVELAEKLFVKKRLLVSFTGEEKLYRAAEPVLSDYLSRLPEGTKAGAAAEFVFSSKRRIYRCFPDTVCGAGGEFQAARI